MLILATFSEIHYKKITSTSTVRIFAVGSSRLKSTQAFFFPVTCHSTTAAEEGAVRTGALSIYHGIPVCLVDSFWKRCCFLISPHTLFWSSFGNATLPVSLWWVEGGSSCTYFNIIISSLYMFLLIYFLFNMATFPPALNVSFFCPIFQNFGGWFPLTCVNWVIWNVQKNMFSYPNKPP